MDNLNTLSSAYQLIEMVWHHNNAKSCSRINRVMKDAVALVINAGLIFNEDDFEIIFKKMRGGYWFGVDTNGKTMGFSFYSMAIACDNPSAIKSFDKYAGIKPFITIEKHRLYEGKKLIRKENRCRVTGFDPEKGTLLLVSYDINDWGEAGEKKLLNFTNKEWLKIRDRFKEM